MLWIGLAAVLLLILYVLLTGRRMGPLFSDEHLVELARAIPDLKRRALAAASDGPASFQTSVLAVAYTITRDETVWIHHISVSNPVTPARAAGTFFLGLVRGILSLEVTPGEVFVSQNRVFHLIVALPDVQQSAFVAAPIETMEASRLRAVAVNGQRVLLPLLEERTLPGA
jgi:hypothetical protein